MDKKRGPNEGYRKYNIYSILAILFSLAPAISLAIYYITVLLFGIGIWYDSSKIMGRLLLHVALAGTYPLGIVFGIVSLVDISNNHSLKGRGMSITAIILSSIWLILSVLLILAIMTWNPLNYM